MTVVYETSYTREEALELLKLSGSPVPRVPGELTDRQLAGMVASAANKTASEGGPGDLYTRLTDDAGPDWIDVADIGDWTASK